MPENVYNALEVLLDAGLVDSITNWMTKLYSSLNSIISTALIGTAMSVLVTISCSLVVLYFFMNLMDQAQRDMFSFEKLIVSFIKMMTAIVVLVCLEDIIVNLLKIGQALYNELRTNDNGILQAFTSSSKSLELFSSINCSHRVSVYDMPCWECAQSVFEDEFGGFFTYLTNFGLAIWSLIIWLFGFVVKIAGYFICTSNAIMILVRAAVSPLAVVQLFDEGSRSPGVRYLKSFAADCITMAFILLALHAASALTSAMVVEFVGIETLEVSNIKEFLSIGNCSVFVIPQLAAVGAMGSVSKIAHDVAGA